MMVAVSTVIRSNEAADILGVSTATLYAYVSRGRLRRSTAPDGRTSLFERDEVERLAQRSRRAAPGPRPTIDVQIRSDITTMHETGLEFRGHDAVALVVHHRFEDVAELLWRSDGSEPPTGTMWPAADRADLDAVAPATALQATPIGRMAIAAHILDALHPSDDAATAARRLLLAVPSTLGSDRRTGSYAIRLTSAWRRRPGTALVDAIDTALALLADHELATSTLAVRIAASVRSTPYAALATGLASVEGVMHGSAAAEVHRFLERCARDGAGDVIATLRRDHGHVPGFGHKVYRGIDPRFEPLMRSIVPLDSAQRPLALVDEVIAEVGRTLPHRPNVDLALGTLTWAAGLEPDTPIFAVARIAGWAAHYAEELTEGPLRFRGVARRP